jgi:predicted nucleic acid-binding protein
LSPEPRGSRIAIAALLADHPAHETATEALAACRTTIAHAAIETYSVLTRLPAPHRVDATTAATVLAGRTPPAYATLDGSAYAKAPALLAAAGVSGGATYDGLIALAALEHDLELLTRDERAERTYRVLGVPCQLLD